ncbi:MAG: adenylyl-sulfate kinase [Lacibacter sp.]|nr:adenylyl-sulfate kinase [Lacibacter sp.]
MKPEKSTKKTRSLLQKESALDIASHLHYRNAADKTYSDSNTVETNSDQQLPMERIDEDVNLEMMAETYMPHFLKYVGKASISKNTVQKAKPCVIWLTGLSAAGKTTLADDLTQKLNDRSVRTISLDGDAIRQAVKLTGFDEQSRRKHNLTVGHIAAKFESQGYVVIVSLISPYLSVRETIRQMCCRFIEVYVSTGIDECIKRDPKGLYIKALNGELKDFTGISAPYEVPANPEITIDTTNKNISTCSDQVIHYYESL